jgi:phosphoenolpyruvate---glycerone phosphotransferase subunit DhaL
VGSDDLARVPAVTIMTVTEAWLRCTARAIHERRVWLTELDAAIGDGDHGINLDRGFAALLGDLEAGVLPTGDAGALLSSAGRRLLGLVGGASGALYGRALMTAGTRLTELASDPEIDRRGLVAIALAGAIDGITTLGRAVPGDKTMLDALAPALDALRAAAPDSPVRDVMLAMADAADAGTQATIPLVARKGRASYLGERSTGHLDPGAASSAILIRCLANAVAAADGQSQPGEASAAS